MRRREGKEVRRESSRRERPERMERKRRTRDEH